MRNANTLKLILLVLTLAMFALVGWATHTPRVHGAEPTAADHWQWLKIKNQLCELETVVPVVPVAPLTPDALSADAQPTPMAAVTAGLNALHLRTDDVFVEFGCGFNAPWAITAAKRGVRKCYGIEIDPRLAESARDYVKANGVADQVEIITGDATKIDVPANVGAAYLWGDTLVALRPKIEKLDRFVSFAHPLPWVNDVPRDPNADTFVYAKPVTASVTVQVPKISQLMQPSVATWKGRPYTHPVCNKPGCTMCNAIRAQLLPQVVTTSPQAPARTGHYETRTQCTVDRWGRKTCRPVQVWVWD